MNLAELNPGEEGIVKEITKNSKIRRRLQDLGLIEGTRVKCISRSPMNDPTAYMIRNAIIALREIDAKEIIIKEVK